MESEIDRVNYTAAESITKDSVQILNILLKQKQIWNYVTIVERANYASAIFSTVANLAVLKNFYRNESSVVPVYPDQSQVVIRTQLFDYDPNQNASFVEFVNDFPGIEIPMANFPPEADSILVASAFVVRGLAPYLSMGYVSNAQVMGVVVEQGRLTQTARASNVIVQYR